MRRSGFVQIASILLVAFSAVTLAAAPNAGHRLCGVKQHQCGKSATVAPSCCGNQDANAAQAPPAQLRNDPSSGLLVAYGAARVSAITHAPAGPSAITRAPCFRLPDHFNRSIALRI